MIKIKYDEFCFQVNKLMSSRVNNKTRITMPTIPFINVEREKKDDPIGGGGSKDTGGISVGPDSIGVGCTGSACVTGIACTG